MVTVSCKLSYHTEDNDLIIYGGTESHDITPILDVENDLLIQQSIDWDNPPLFNLNKIRMKGYLEFMTLIAFNTSEIKIGAQVMPISISW